MVVAQGNKKKEFSFDQVFMPDSTQEQVYDDTHRLIQSAVDGYNVCIFAYGQTGSGKTFTMIGDSARPMNFPGLAPRAFADVFSIIKENENKYRFRVSCYMIEIYRDRLCDLFGSQRRHTAGPEKLKVHLNKRKMVFVEGAIVKPASSAEELYAHFEVRVRGVFRGASVCSHRAAVHQLVAPRGRSVPWVPPPPVPSILTTLPLVLPRAARRTARWRPPT